MLTITEQAWTRCHRCEFWGVDLAVQCERDSSHVGTSRCEPMQGSINPIVSCSHGYARSQLTWRSCSSYGSSTQWRRPRWSTPARVHAPWGIGHAQWLRVRYCHCDLIGAAATTRPATQLLRRADGATTVALSLSAPGQPACGPGLQMQGPSQLRRAAAKYPAQMARLRTVCGQVSRLECRYTAAVGVWRPQAGGEALGAGRERALASVLTIVCSGIDVQALAAAWVL